MQASHFEILIQRLLTNFFEICISPFLPILLSTLLNCILQSARRERWWVLKVAELHSCKGLESDLKIVNFAFSLSWGGGGSPNTLYLIYLALQESYCQFWWLRMTKAAMQLFSLCVLQYSWEKEEIALCVCVLCACTICYVFLRTSGVLIISQQNHIFCCRQSLLFITRPNDSLQDWSIWNRTCIDSVG